MAVLTLLMNCFDDDCRAHEDQRVHVLGLPHLDEADELALRGRGVGAADREDRFPALLHADRLEHGVDHRLDPVGRVGLGEHSHGLAVENVMRLHERHHHLQLSIRRDVRSDHQRRRRLGDDRVSEAVGDERRVVLLRDAQLRVARRVVKAPDNREHVVVLGERRTRGERLRTLHRADLLVVGHDLAAVDPAVLVDVVDVVAPHRLLIDIDGVDVALDALVVDERDAQLDRRRGDTGTDARDVGHLGAPRRGRG